MFNDTEVEISNEILIKALRDHDDIINNPNDNGLTRDEIIIREILDDFFENIGYLFVLLRNDIGCLWASYFVLKNNF